jgi:hypothetical protein
VVAGAALVAGLAGPASYALTTAGTPHTGSIPTAGPSTGGGLRGMGGGPGGATTGGLLEGSQSSAAITTMLQTDADSYTWAAAAIGSNSAAGYQLASQESVMPIGGFNGSDPSPTLAQFKSYVANGEIHYFISGGGGFGGGGGGGSDTGTGSAISTWVAATFTATTVDGVTIYDLSTGVQ